MKKNIMNFFTLLMGSVLGSLLMFVGQIILARSFSVEDFGNFATVTNLVNIIAVFVGFGVGDFLVKIFSTEGEKAYRWVRPSFKILYINLIVSVMIIAILLLSGVYSNTVNILVLLFIPNIILQGLLTLSNAVNQIEEDFLKNSILNLSIYVVRFVSILIALMTTVSITAIGISIFILSLVTLYPFLKNISKFFKGNIDIPNQPEFKLENNADFKSSLQQIYPFGVMGIFYFAYYQSDILILSYYEGPESTAFYSAAFSILSMVYLFPNLLFRKLFLTKIHLWANHNNDKLVSFFKKSSLLMSLLGVIVTTAVYFLSASMISIIYGGKYDESAIYLSLLSLCIVFRFIYSISGTILSTKDNIYLKIKIQGVTALINIIGNFILIPHFGIKGAIVSTIISEFILCICFYVGTKRYFAKIREKE